MISYDYIFKLKQDSIDFNVFLMYVGSFFGCVEGIFHYGNLASFQPVVECWFCVGSLLSLMLVLLIFSEYKRKL